MNNQILSTSDKACEILKKTHDGDNLSPNHLKLLENAINGFLNENGLKVFNELYKKIIKDGYTKPWFMGLENFTQDLEGYVYYKGVHVEHYSFNDYDEALKALKKLEKRCLYLESKGIKPDSINAIWKWDKKEAGF